MDTTPIHTRDWSSGTDFKAGGFEPIPSSTWLRLRPSESPELYEAIIVISSKKAAAATAKQRRAAATARVGFLLKWIAAALRPKSIALDTAKAHEFSFADQNGITAIFGSSGCNGTPLYASGRSSTPVAGSNQCGKTPSTTTRSTLDQTRHKPDTTTVEFESNSPIWLSSLCRI